MIRHELGLNAWLMERHAKNHATWATATRNQFAQSINAIMATVKSIAKQLVDWRTQVGNAEFRQFAQALKDTFQGETAEGLVKGVADRLFPGAGPVAAFLTAHTLGIQGVVSSRAQIGDAKAMNRFLGGLVKGGIDVLVGSAGDAAKALTEAAFEFGTVEQLVVRGFADAKDDIQRILAMASVQRDQPSADMRKFAEAELRQSQELIQEFTRRKIRVDGLSSGLQRLTSRVRSDGERAFKHVQLKYVGYKGFGRAAKGIPSPAAGKKRYLQLNAKATLLRRPPLNGHLSIALQSAEVEGFSPGEFAKSATRSTRRPLTALDKAMQAALLPQEIGDLVAAEVELRVVVTMQKGGRLVAHATKKKKKPTQFRIEGKEDFVRYLSGGRGASNEAMNTLLRRLWVHVSGRQLGMWRSGASLFSLDDPGEFEPARVPVKKGK